MKYLWILLFCAQPLAAQTFSVVHEKRLWRDGRGELTITDESISYKAKKKKNSRTWTYLDIQYFDRISDKEIAILTYEDEHRLLGRDKQYHFIITGGELTDEVFEAISRRLARPITNRVVPEVAEVQFEVPVKHLHTFGGCEGTLKFTRDWVYYDTDYKKDAREWRLERDVQSVWSMDRYQLEIHTYDNNRRQFSRTRIYRFDLKQPLDPVFYRKLKLKLYDLEKAHLPLSVSGGGYDHLSRRNK